QWPASAKIPPIAGPASLATPHLLDNSAVAWGQRRSSNTRPAGEGRSPSIKPPPHPCSVRAASIQPMVGASAHAAVPAANNPIAARKACCGPYLSNAVGDSAELRIDAKTNSVMFQAK